MHLLFLATRGREAQQAKAEAKKGTGTKHRHRHSLSSQPSCSTLSASTWPHWPCAHQVTARHKPSQPHPCLFHGSPPLTIPRSKAVTNRTNPLTVKRRRTTVAKHCAVWMIEASCFKSSTQCFYVMCQDGSSRPYLFATKYDFCVQQLERLISGISCSTSRSMCREHLVDSTAVADQKYRHG